VPKRYFKEGRRGEIDIRFTKKSNKNHFSHKAQERLSCNSTERNLTTTSNKT